MNLVIATFGDPKSKLYESIMKKYKENINDISSAVKTLIDKIKNELVSETGVWSHS